MGRARPGRPQGGRRRAGRAGQPTTQLTGAEILRHAVGLEGSPLGRRHRRRGQRLGRRAARAGQRGLHRARSPAPEGFDGELRSYQAEALAWLGFLDAVELGGCLALDMGLGKTPTVLAHLARTAGRRHRRWSSPRPPSSATGRPRPPASRPGLRVVVHHGAVAGRRPTSSPAEVADADVVITTYGTAVRDVDALAAPDVGPAWSSTRPRPSRTRPTRPPSSCAASRPAPALALTGTPIENGLGDLWAILDFTNPGLVGTRPAFIAQLSGEGEAALRALNGILVFRRTKSEPAVAAELPDRIDELDHCTMTPEQIGLYQAVLDSLVADSRRGRRRAEAGRDPRRHHRAQADLQPPRRLPGRRPPAGRPLRQAGPARGDRRRRSSPPASGSSSSPTSPSGASSWPTTSPRSPACPIACYHGGLARGARDQLVAEFQSGEGPGALVLSLKAGGTGLNLTAASHVVLYDRWWNPAVEDQARDRAWRIGQTRTVVSHRLVCPGTVDERVEEVVAGKRHIADLVLPEVELAGRPRRRPAARRPRPAAGRPCSPRRAHERRGQTRAERRAAAPLEVAAAPPPQGRRWRQQRARATQRAAALDNGSGTVGTTARR